MQPVTLIVAASRNGTIGRDGHMPWRIPSDLRRFRRRTMGLDIVMGRRTWDSIGRPLPGRRTIVLSRGAPDLPDGVIRCRSVQEAVEAAEGRELAIVGGSEIYGLFVPMASRILRTTVQADLEGDASFPPIGSGWVVVSSEDHHDPEDSHPTTFEILLRDQAVGYRADGATAFPPDALAADGRGIEGGAAIT